MFSPSNWSTIAGLRNLKELSIVSQNINHMNHIADTIKRLRNLRKVMVKIDIGISNWEKEEFSDPRRQILKAIMAHRVIYEVKISGITF